MQNSSTQHAQPLHTPMIQARNMQDVAAIIAEIPAEKPVLIAGPTASGKSSLAMAIAEAQGGQIINADAIQVYGCFRVLTARPSLHDEDTIVHRLYGHLAADKPYSVGDWLQEVMALAKQPRWIITGGTGLYFRALTEGLAEAPAASPEVRQRAMDIESEQGIAALLNDLIQRDPVTASRIDQANPRRVMRAWEVLETSGRGLASWQDNTPAPFLPLHKTTAIAVNAARDILRERAAKRARAMVRGGALEEVEALRPIWRPDLPAAKAIGAAELMAHLNGELSIEAATERLIIATNQYIKRQQTWLKRHMREGWQAVDAATEQN